MCVSYWGAVIRHVEACRCVSRIYNKTGPRGILNLHVLFCHPSIPLLRPGSHLFHLLQPVCHTELLSSANLHKSTADNHIFTYTEIFCFCLDNTIIFVDTKFTRHQCHLVHSCHSCACCRLMKYSCLPQQCSTCICCCC